MTTAIVPMAGDATTSARPVVARIVERTCMSNPRFDSVEVARRAAWRFRHFTMHVIRAYPCPFSESEEPHWHVGHVESLTV